MAAPNLAAVVAAAVAAQAGGGDAGAAEFGETVAEQVHREVFAEYEW